MYIVLVLWARSELKQKAKNVKHVLITGTHGLGDSCDKGAIQRDIDYLIEEYQEQQQPRMTRLQVIGTAAAALVRCSQVQQQQQAVLVGAVALNAYLVVGTSEGTAKSENAKRATHEQKR